MAWEGGVAPEDGALVSTLGQMTVTPLPGHCLGCALLNHPLIMVLYRPVEAMERLNKARIKWWRSNQTGEDQDRQCTRLLTPGGEQPTMHTALQDISLRNFLFLLEPNFQKLVNLVNGPVVVSNTFKF